MLQRIAMNKSKRSNGPQFASVFSLRLLALGEIRDYILKVHAMGSEIAPFELPQR